MPQSTQIGHMRQSMVCTCWQPPPSQHWKCPSGVYQKHGCIITAVHGTHLSDSCSVTTVVLPLHDELYHCQCIIIRTQYMLFINEYTIFNCLRSWDLVQNSKVLLVVTTVPLSFVLNRLRPPDTGADAYVWSYQPGALQRCLNCYQHLNITHGTAGWGDIYVYWLQNCTAWHSVQSWQVQLVAKGSFQKLVAQLSSDLHKMEVCPVCVKGMPRTPWTRWTDSGWTNISAHCVCIQIAAALLVKTEAATSIITIYSSLKLAPTVNAMLKVAWCNSRSSNKQSTKWRVCRRNKLTSKPWPSAQARYIDFLADNLSCCCCCSWLCMWLGSDLIVALFQVQRLPQQGSVVLPNSTCPRSYSFSCYGTFKC